MENKIKLGDYEQITFDIIAQLHECPWYKRIFKKKKHTHEQYIIIEKYTEIGIRKIMICNCCGRNFDITDVNY